MPIRPSLIENLLFFTLNQGPAPLLDIWNAVAFRAVAAGIRLGVFEMLGEASKTTEELAGALDLNARGCALLLKMLATLGYVRQHDDRFRLTPMANKWLTSSAEANFAPYFTFWDTVLHELWNNLEDSLRSGKSPTNLYEWIEGQPETSLDFQQAMIAIASLVSVEIAGKLKFLQGSERLLDIGGGHGEYSIALCRKYPHLKAVIFDSPQALEAGRTNIISAGLAERITFQEGNFLSDDLGTGYEAVLVFNILHGFTPPQNTDLFRKVARALKPGGRIVVLDQLDEKIPLAALNATAKVLALSYFHMLGGQTYTYGEIAAWLENADFHHIERINLTKVPGNALIVGTALDGR